VSIFSYDELDHFIELTPIQQIEFFASRLVDNKDWSSDLLKQDDFIVFPVEGDSKTRVYLTDTLLIVGYNRYSKCRNIVQHLVQEGYVLSLINEIDIRSILSSELWRQNKHYRCYRIIQFDMPLCVN